MYCPSCGAEYPQKTNFCKRCGANIAPTGNSVEFRLPRPPRVTGMFIAVAAFSFAGLAASMAFLNELSFRDQLDGRVKFFAFFASLLFVFGISSLLIWQLARMISTWQQTVRQSVQKAQNELSVHAQSVLPPPQYQPVQIAAPQESVPSVIEHTTRSLYTGPGTRE